VKKEIETKGPAIGQRQLDTLYFGGGTPSVVEPRLLVAVITALKENGFPLKPSAEVTLEINPGTISEKDLDILVKGGFNRFSVGVQTFDDRLLDLSRRKHSAADTRSTLKLLGQNKLNYSTDVLFSLPTQSIEGLKDDLQQLLEFSPPHVSPYCLTVPEGHPFSKNRAPEGEQIEMFSTIEDLLVGAGHQRYEISNFSKPGFESRHNLIYWTDQEYWGVGNSSHSYMKKSVWGSRFWNPRGIDVYSDEIAGLSHWSLDSFEKEKGEILNRHEALTDFFHISLRMSFGLDPDNFENKFNETLETVAGDTLNRLSSQGLMEKSGRKWGLTSKGKLLSNQVFAQFTFGKRH
jgi:oxygen-independent coproporphyrinogen-3 oxidase